MSGDRGTVAITGANGTIGYACTVYALETGYRVRCIVRREGAIAIIKSGPSVQAYLDRIDYAVVPDNAAPGAYDDAIKGVDYVVHVAGAWPMPHLHPDTEIYYPFLNSMKNMLDAAGNSGTVKRIVFTQAAAGLVNSEDGDTLGQRMDQILDENIQVNQTSLSYKPPLKSPHNAYCASKAQCMTHLLSLQRLASTRFSIAQVIPGTVIGPSEFAITRAEALAQMDRQTAALLFDKPAPRYAFGFVHVRDCARVHVEALDEEAVRREDLPPWFVAAATQEEGVDGRAVWSAVAGMVEREFAEEVQDGVFTVGRGKVPVNMPFRVDSRVTERMVMGGERIRGLEESVREVAGWYVGLRRVDE